MQLSREACKAAVSYKHDKEKYDAIYLLFYARSLNIT
jgi:hypothetical protein